jgi:uncharacterized protein YlxW (UPF0749 family)
MNAVNRLFIAVLALAWVGLMGFLVYLVWTPGEFIEINNTSMNTRFELLFDTTAEQTLASIVLGVLMLPAVMLLFMEATVRDTRARDVGAEVKLERDRNKQLQSRIEELEKQLESERKRDADTVRRVADRDERVETHDANDGRVTPARRWHLFGR